MSRNPSPRRQQGRSLSRLKRTVTRLSAAALLGVFWMSVIAGIQETLHRTNASVSWKYAAFVPGLVLSWLMVETFDAIDREWLSGDSEVGTATLLKRLGVLAICVLVGVGAVSLGVMCIPHSHQL